MLKATEEDKEETVEATVSLAVAKKDVLVLHWMAFSCSKKNKSFIFVFFFCFTIDSVWQELVNTAARSG